MNMFLNQLGQKDTTTWNGAISNSTSGSSLLDYFAKCGSYRGRSCMEVNTDISSIINEDPYNGLKTIFYNRMITRRPKGFNNEADNVHKGQGQKDEFIKSLAWLENNHPVLLYKNLYLVPIVGTWKDLWYDSPTTKFYYYINTDKVYELVSHGLRSEYHRALIAKYLPQIRSRKNTYNNRQHRLNAWGRGFCKYMNWSERDYRKFKSDPENTAHLWQRKMCSNKWYQMDFNTVSGKALFNMLSQRGKDGKNVIERHGLEEKYLDWIKTKPVAKFTGYPYELYQKASKNNRTLAEKYTYDKQFDGLLEKARDSVPPELLNKGVLCALDTSGSMSSNYFMGGIQDSGIAPIDICVGLGLYFSSLLEGHFHNHVMMFDNHSQFLKLYGDSFCDKCDQIKTSATAWGGTNFQSVIDEIVRVRKQNPNIPIEDYPEVLLIVSDMQFNVSNRYYNIETNYETAMRKLRSVGLPDMTIIWWHVNGQKTDDVPSTMFDSGTVLISGFDGSIVTSILGGMEEVIDEKTGEKRKKTPHEMMMECLDQEVLNKIVT